MRDEYRTLERRHEARIKVERSDFLGIAFPVTREEAFFAELTRKTKETFDATHHCWAFRLLVEERTRSADAGEPSGTAGKPILSAIEGADLFDVAIVVVRWYGGVKLGTGGLSRAYRDCAAAALQNEFIVTRFVYRRFRVEVPFTKFASAHFLVDRPHVVMAGVEYGDVNVFDFDVRLTRADAFRHALAELRLTILP